MDITIKINEPLTQVEDIIGLKEDLAYVLELNGLTVDRFDFKEVLK